MVLSELHQAVRREFPRAEIDAKGRKRIFFENGAGSLVLQRVAETEAKARIEFGPSGAKLHESDEYVDIESVGKTAAVYHEIMRTLFS